ncbi:outer membrane homotrimeric porin [Desulfobaculum bizertense]|uniref:Outer membrane porin, OprD family n=1 Tax=Desulfobaculum bizertense DSM 18034 TaxID=1121442 RepID=A0A1T4VP65_9BACT|nr:outer membrane homotrimeric porin [Desulfobaculum bizertense]SKA66750.1 hypothetical protein SAMN02745702_00662 [Desulfobaculum bizertense DSM 18034]
MKRIITLALVAAYVLSMAGFASAKEVNMKAEFIESLQWSDNHNFKADDGEDDFTAKQRVRVYFDYVASETLNAVLGLEISHSWGQKGAQLGTDGDNVKVKHAYTNFVVPGTEVAVRAGLQPFAYKGAYGSPIFDDDAAGIVINAPINDAVALSAAWIRAFDNANGDKNDADFDLFTLAADIQGEGFAVTPYAVYGALGQNALESNSEFYAHDTAAGLATIGAIDAEENADVYWAGINYEVTMFDPFTIKGDVIYGAVAADEDKNDRSGWFADLGVEYKLGFGTLGVAALYGTGDDDDISDGSEAMPVLNDSGFSLTSFGFSGATGTGADSLLGSARYDMWAIGAYLADFSFVEDLSHKFIVVYGQGTTDSEAVEGTDVSGNDFAPVLTDEDSFIEVNFDSTYQIYENLAAIVELGYIHMDRDDDTWKASDLDDAEDAYKAAFYLKYNF